MTLLHLPRDRHGDGCPDDPEPRRLTVAVRHLDPLDFLPDPAAEQLLRDRIRQAAPGPGRAAALLAAAAGLQQHPGVSGRLALQLVLTAATLGSTAAALAADLRQRGRQQG